MSALPNAKKNFEKIKNKIKRIINATQALSLEQLQVKMKLFNDEIWIKAFNELLDDGIIQETARCTSSLNSVMDCLLAL